MDTTQAQEAAGAAVVPEPSLPLPEARTVFERLLVGQHRVELVQTEGKPLVLIVVERIIHHHEHYDALTTIEITDEEAKALGMALYDAGGGF